MIQSPVTDSATSEHSVHRRATQPSMAVTHNVCRRAPLSPSLTRGTPVFGLGLCERQLRIIFLQNKFPCLNRVLSVRPRGTHQHLNILVTNSSCCIILPATWQSFLVFVGRNNFFSSDDSFLSGAALRYLNKVEVYEGILHDSPPHVYRRQY